MIETDGDLGLIPYEEADTERFYRGTILYSETKTHSITCIYGFRPPSQKNDVFYHPSVGFRSEHKREQNYFVKLECGALTWSSGPPFTYSKTYVASKLFTSFPTGTKNYFGVFDENRSLNTEATVSAFGFTFEELTKVLEAYSDVFGLNKYIAGRITFSGTRDNYCDLTGNTIPSNFPYIKFSEPWSHISLFGFYSHLSLLLKNDDKSVIYQVMIKSGCTEELLNRLIEIPFQHIQFQVCLRY